jgi:hypothetical protein
MDNKELGKKIEEAAYLLQVVMHGPNNWDVTVGDPPRKPRELPLVRQGDARDLDRSRAGLHGGAD